MGLDVTFYGKVKKIGRADSYGDYEEKFDWFETFYVYPDDSFPGWSDGLDDNGVYSYEVRESIAAGSYSGYNNWRDELSLMALGVPAGVVWYNNEEYEDKPFFRLINFSDCEGFIGPAHCKKLLQDFRDYEKAAADVGGYFYQKYVEWMEMLEEADGDGCLQFH